MSVEPRTLWAEPKTMLAESETTSAEPGTLFVATETLFVDAQTLFVASETMFVVPYAHPVAQVADIARVETTRFAPSRLHDAAPNRRPLDFKAYSSVDKPSASVDRASDRTNMVHRAAHGAQR